MSVDSPFSSIELRWFFAADAPQASAIDDWFAETTPLPQQIDVVRPEALPRLDAAPDRYLALPGIDDLNIKWREGLFQVKGRRFAATRAEYPPLHAGLVEHWVKWSYAEMPASWRERWFDADDEAIVDVHKVRRMRLFDIEAGPTNIEETPLDRRLERGVAFELTDIEVRGTAFQTLGFEAFPDDATTQRGFECVVTALLATLTDIELGARRSQSYAGWLAGLN